MSDDHIANVILRLYVRYIIPFPRPFGLEFQIPDEVWDHMVKKVAEMREYLLEWHKTEKEELWNR
jgi:hypothetical protein